MNGWKALSLGLLLALALVSSALASPAPQPALAGGAACTAATPAEPAAPAAAPLAALWATSPTQSWDLPAPPAARACSLNSCTGTGACVCPNGRIGTCMNNNCTF